MARGLALVLAIIASLALVACQSSNRFANTPRRITFSEIHQDPSLIGKAVRFHSCMGIPLTTVVDETEEFLLLFPCNVKLDGAITEDTVLFARLSSMEVAQPIADAEIDPGEIVEANFTGTLSKERIEKDDDREYLILTIGNVSKPRGRGDSAF